LFGGRFSGRIDRARRAALLDRVEGVLSPPATPISVSVTDLGIESECVLDALI